MSQSADPGDQDRVVALEAVVPLLVASLVAAVTGGLIAVPVVRALVRHLVSGLTGSPFPPVKEVNLPAADPLVLGVGGTTLTSSHKTGAYISESAWGLPYVTRAARSRDRAAASAASSPAPPTKTACRASAPTGGSPTWPPTRPLTLPSSPPPGPACTRQRPRRHQRQRPLWAGLVALADQYAGRALGFVNAGLYRVAETSRYHAAFHDVTTGTIRSPSRRGRSKASRGWDAVTGWGSPDASVLVPLLTRNVHGGDANGL